MLFVAALIVLVALASAGQESCGPNEMWTECTGCELKCGEPDDVPCTKACGPPSCECSAWREMRRTEDGKCIPEYMCHLKQA